MPETGIGLFPDVGGGWYLSRLAGRIGEYLALTGARLDGAECLWAGLATHYLAAASLPEAKRRIAGGEEIEAVLGSLAAVPPAPRIADHAEAIARLFAADRYEDILAALGRDDSTFAQTTSDTLKAKSPQACKVSLRLLSESRRLNHLCDEMALEYRIGSRVLLRPDFAEGVRALIVDKTNDPAWIPATPEDVSDEMLDAIFAPLPADEEWTPL
jgi:enoyl-CoA hydratase